MAGKKSYTCNPSFVCMARLLVTRGTVDCYRVCHVGAKVEFTIEPRQQHRSYDILYGVA